MSWIKILNQKVNRKCKCGGNLYEDKGLIRCHSCNYGDVQNSINGSIEGSLKREKRKCLKQKK